MIAKAVALALASAPLVAPVQSDPVYADIPAVHQVLCDGGTVRGTAFRTGSYAMVTARHVTHGRDCTIDGEKAVVTWESEKLDMAVIRTKVLGKPFRINCLGYVSGEPYAAIGYAKGLPIQRVIFVVFDALLDGQVPRWNEFKTLAGDRFIPGMSGGVVENREGEAVGIVNGYSEDFPLSFSQPLSATPLCQH